MYKVEQNYSGTILLSEETTSQLMAKSGLVGSLANIFSNKTSKRLELPLTIGGTFDKPKIEIDYSALTKSAGENLIKGLFDKVKK